MKSVRDMHSTAGNGIRILFFLMISLTLEVSYAQDTDRAKATIDSLCSREMYGRGYVQEGHLKAARFIAGKFKEYGLLSAGDNKVNPYFQNFRFNINTFPGAVSLKLGKVPMELGTDYIMTPFSQSGKGRAKTVILDSGKVTDAVYMKTFMAQNLKNKLLVYNELDHNAIMNLEENSLEYIKKIYDSKAIIKVKNSKLTASLATSQYAPPVFEILKDSLPGNFKKGKFKVETALKNETSQNVIGYIEGSEQPDSFMVFTAHYDHLGGMGSVFFPGANDNAAGIAMLLELASYYAQPGNKPKHSILFIAFSAEEAGLIGSKYYTSHPYFPLKTIKFLMNLDLVGTGSEGATIVNGTTFRSEFDRLVEINEKAGYLPKIKIRGEAANSDHYFFTQEGVPSFFIYLMGGPPAYHDVYDVPETLPLTKFEEVFKMLVEFEHSF